MRVIVTSSYEELSQKAFEVMKDVVKGNPKAILGLATGSSPIGMYQNMIKDHRENGTSYREIKSVNLDEYVGLDIGSDQSYVYFMHHNLFDSIDILPENTSLPNGKAADPASECDRYNALLAGMQQDIQVLGIGSNGHIAFNEPGTSFDSVTHIVKLQEGTRKDNARFFQSIDEVPTHAFTMGLSNIMNAKQILVLANGKGKASAVKAMIEGEPNENCPASILQRHPNVVVVVDEEAAADLSKK